VTGSPLDIAVFDRHAEHVDPGVPFCDHGRFRLWPGDSLMLIDTQGQVGFVKLTDDGTLEILLDTNEYRRAARRRRRWWRA
jgi:hypothetical protein